MVSGGVVVVYGGSRGGEQHRPVLQSSMHSFLCLKQERRCGRVKREKERVVKEKRDHVSM